MADTLLEFQHPVAASDGTLYRARACGAPFDGATWQGWLEFEPMSPGTPVRSERETTQPNRTDAEYWATGLTQIYLEGALSRALNPRIPPARAGVEPRRFEEPAVPSAPVSVHEDGNRAPRKDAVTER